MDEIARFEHRSAAAYSESLVERDLRARDEAFRIIHRNVAAGLHDAPAGEVTRRSGESDADDAARSSVPDALSGAWRIRNKADRALPVIPYGAFIRCHFPFGDPPGARAQPPSSMHAGRAAEPKAVPSGCAVPCARAAAQHVVSRLGRAFAGGRRDRWRGTQKQIVQGAAKLMAARPEIVEIRGGGSDTQTIRRPLR